MKMILDPKVFSLSELKDRTLILSPVDANVSYRSFFFEVGVLEWELVYLSYHQKLTADKMSTISKSL